MTLLLTLLLTLSLTACASSSNTQDVKLITVGTSPDFPPYESLTVDGELVGFEIDLVKKFEQFLKAQDPTYKVEFKQMDFDNIILQLQGSQIDLGVSGFYKTADREAEWSTPYLGGVEVAIVPEGSDIKTLDDLKGKSIVTQTGSTSYDAAMQIEGAKVTGLKNVQESMNALAAHQYDASVVDKVLAKQYAQNANFTILDGELSNGLTYAIAKKGNTQIIELFNSFIDNFIKTQEYIDLCHEYGFEPIEVK